MPGWLCECVIDLSLSGAERFAPEKPKEGCSSVRWRESSATPRDKYDRPSFRSPRHLLPFSVQTEAAKLGQQHITVDGVTHRAQNRSHVAEVLVGAAVPEVLKLPNDDVLWRRDRDGLTRERDRLPESERPCELRENWQRARRAEPLRPIAPLE